MALNSSAVLAIKKNGVEKKLFIPMEINAGKGIQITDNNGLPVPDQGAAFITINSRLPDTITDATYSNASITVADGEITAISNGGSVSIAGTTNQISVSTFLGTSTISLSNEIILPGTIRLFTGTAPTTLVAGTMWFEEF
jgi:hypothetical protein